MKHDAAFSEFVAARQTHLRRVAYALCGDWHRADDLLQTALTKLYVAWPRIRHEGGEESYTRQIMVRANIDESRRPWRRERPSDDLPEVAASTGTGLEERSALITQLSGLGLTGAALEDLLGNQSNRGIAAMIEAGEIDDLARAPTAPIPTANAAKAADIRRSGFSESKNRRLEARGASQTK